MTVNTPKDPIDGVTEWTNEETGIKYRYVDGAWRAVSSKAAQDVADAITGIDLQRVTENGNSTNQGIEVKNSRLKTYGEVYFQSDGSKPVTLDSGSSYLPMVHLKSYSNTTTTEEGEADTFARKDVLKISARGEAELFGHLKTQPGENSNQVIVYDQYKELQDSIVSLQQEIEKLSLVLDEGGDYRLLSTPENPADFVRDGIVYFGNTAGNPITDPSSWDEVGSIFIDEKDRNGATHDFGPDVVRPGDLIELIGDNSFALFEVKGTGQYEEGLNKKFAVWATTIVKATGVPGPQDTDYKIKSFRLGSLDVAETDARYVNLTGDEMTGPLQIKPETAAVALDLHPGPNQSSGTSILRVYGDGGKTNLYVSGSGSLGARQGWSPSLSNHLTTKDYVDLLDAQARDYIDSKVAAINASRNSPSPYAWKRQNRSSGAPSSGHWYIYNGFIYLSYHTDNGAELRTSLAIKDKKANDFNGAAVMMSFWTFKNNQYELVQTCEAFKWRGTYNGVLQLEVHREKIDWGTIPYEELHYISVPSFF